MFVCNKPHPPQVGVQLGVVFLSELDLEFQACGRLNFKHFCSPPQKARVAKYNERRRGGGLSGPKFTTKNQRGEHRKNDEITECRGTSLDVNV